MRHVVGEHRRGVERGAVLPVAHRADGVQVLREELAHRLSMLAARRLDDGQQARSHFARPRLRRRLLRLRRRQLARGDPDQLGQPSALVETVLDEEVELGAGVRRRLDHVADERPPAGRRLHEQLVVADQGDHLVVAVDGELAEHLALPDLPGVAHLVAHVLDELDVGAHRFVTPSARGAGPPLPPPGTRPCAG